MSDDNDNVVLFPMDAEIERQARELCDLVRSRHAAAFAAAYITPDGGIFTTHSSVRGADLITQLWAAVGYLDEDVRALVVPYWLAVDVCHAPRARSCQDISDEVLRVIDGGSAGSEAAPVELQLVKCD